ncbi:MAG: Sua5/YciO/YrdC/YwlC family protein, partial [Armatimonadota bacterium]|nr:Sua5/YciO/YrdC/YwlC family protein [Armatimonadota bacterium]
MPARVLRVDPAAPEHGVIEGAAAILASGGLVAFPTETVYGLGADAFNARAVGRLFEVKGRPADNPIIVHIADGVALADLVTD